MKTSEELAVEPRNRPMPGRPTVSCILPVYNGEKYLREAVQSILDQNFQDFELIIIDDGSADGSYAIASEMAGEDSRIVVIRQANAGISKALNAGIDASRGRYIARMDADDISLPHRFSVQVAHLDSHRSCIMVGGIAETFSSQGPGELTSGGRHLRTNLTVFPPKISCAVHPMIMVRRELFDKIGGYRELFPHAEDWDLFLRASRYGSIDNPKDVLFKYRKHEQSISKINTLTQETSAVMAETCAIFESIETKTVADSVNLKVVSRLVWPKHLFDAYVKFRVLRRLSTANANEREFYNSEIVGLITNVDREALLSWRYWRLRVVMMGYLIKDYFARLKPSQRM